MSKRKRTNGKGSGREKSTRVEGEVLGQTFFDFPADILEREAEFRPRAPIAEEEGEEAEDVVFTEARQSEGLARQTTRQPSKRKAAKKKTQAKRGCKRKRAPSIKARLLKKLRAKKKLLQANLRAVERDIRSLSPRRRLTEG